MKKDILHKDGSKTYIVEKEKGWFDNDFIKIDDLQLILLIEKISAQNFDKTIKDRSRTIFITKYYWENEPYEKERMIKDFYVCELKIEK